MRWLAIALAAIAVASPAAADRGEPSRLEWLLDARLTGTQIRLQPRATLRWSAGGPAIAGATLSGDESFKRLRDDKPGARVVVSGPAVELAVYVDAAGISPVVARRALLRPASARTGEQPGERVPGVHLEPGARIRPGRRRTRTTAARIEIGAIHARGVIDTAAIATDFIPASGPKPDGDADWRQVKPPLSLRARPGGGAAIARLAGDQPLNARLLETRGGSALIAYDEERATAVGWIPRRRLLPGEANAWGTIGLGSIGRRLRFDAGTILAATAGGEPIGVITQNTGVSFYSRSGAWTEIGVSTRVGEIRVWASPDRMESE